MAHKECDWSSPQAKNWELESVCGVQLLGESSVQTLGRRSHAGYTGLGGEVLGWQLIGASCDMCCPDVSSHSSTDQVKGVMTLQGDALCQAVSTCNTSCFVWQWVGITLISL